jgi:uncharacterized protein
MPPAALTIPLADGNTICGLLAAPANAETCYVFAHGAGAGMNHPFMAAIARGLADRGVATLRFQFPFIERGSKRPDPPQAAHAAVRAAIREASKQLPDVPLFAGGKSYGGRMTSQAQAAEPLANVLGLVFLGFPLHPAGKPSIERAGHLADVGLPMLFLQGTRDPLAHLGLLRSATATLQSPLTLHVVCGADHSFHVPARSGRTDEQVLEELIVTMAEWMRQIVGRRPGRCARPPENSDRAVR